MGEGTLTVAKKHECNHDRADLLPSHIMCTLLVAFATLGAVTGTWPITIVTLLWASYVELKMLYMKLTGHVWYSFYEKRRYDSFVEARNKAQAAYASLNNMWLLKQRMEAVPTRLQGHVSLEWGVLQEKVNSIDTRMAELSNRSERFTVHNMPKDRDDSEVCLQYASIPILVEDAVQGMQAINQRCDELMLPTRERLAIEARRKVRDLEVPVRLSVQRRKLSEFRPVRSCGHRHF